MHKPDQIDCCCKRRNSATQLDELLTCAFAQVYNQIYNTTVPGNGGATALNYTSPLLHTVVLSGLTPNTKYYYRVGDGSVYSGIYNFTSLAAPSKLCMFVL